jgi:hypothetical protein
MKHSHYLNNQIYDISLVSNNKDSNVQGTSKVIPVSQNFHMVILLVLILGQGLVIE